MENVKTFTPKSCCGRLQEAEVNKGGFNYKALTEQFFGILEWCWLIGAGRLPVVVTHKGSFVVSID